jgi:hypothetical protein
MGRTAAQRNPTDEEVMTIPEICAALKKVSRSTFYAWRQT